MSTVRTNPAPAPSSVTPHADPVLARQWMAVARSGDLAASPRRVQVLGEPIVLWRSAEGVRAFGDLCVHRGAALSLGRVVENTLMCPYHGWRYGEDGRCVGIPAQPEGAGIPTKARAFRYGCLEAYGLIWVALDAPDKDVPGKDVPDQGVPPHEEAHGGSFRTLVCGPYVLEAEPPRIIENFLDVSHLMWVHEGMLGDSAHAEIPEHRVHARNGRLVSDPIDIFQPDPDGRGRGVTNRYVYEVLAPTTARFRKTDSGSDNVLAMMLHATPLGEGKSLVYALLSRNYDLDVSDEVFAEFQNTLMEQDRRIVESQRPERLPLDLQAELHLKSDRLAIAYRRYLTDEGVRLGTA